MGEILCASGSYRTIDQAIRQQEFVAPRPVLYMFATTYRRRDGL